MSEFVAGLHEVFERLGHIEARRMFGGHGIFHDGRMIGLVMRDTLYLKVDSESAADFDAIDAPAFTYQRQGKATELSYREAPADIFDDRDIAGLWGRRAWEAAMRSGQPAKVRKPRPVAAPLKSRIAKKT